MKKKNKIKKRKTNAKIDTKQVQTRHLMIQSVCNKQLCKHFGFFVMIREHCEVRSSLEKNLPAHLIFNMCLCVDLVAAAATVRTTTTTTLQNDDDDDDGTRRQDGMRRNYFKRIHCVG